MNDFAVLPVEGELRWVFDFTAQITGATTLSSVAYSTDPAVGGLTLASQSDDLANKKSSILVKGAEHGRTYTVQAIGTTSAGEKIPKDLTIQGFNC